MRWIVGIDVRPDSQGAARFAAWMCRHDRDPASVRLIGVLTVEREIMRGVERAAYAQEVLDAARRTGRDVLEAAGLAEQFHRIDVVEGMTASESLAGALGMHAADVVCVARRAGRDSSSPYRLGRTARRLLRALPSPVVVTPPDLLPSQLGDGPVVCAVDGTTESLVAARFARRVAHRLERDVRLVHVVRLPWRASPFGLPESVYLDLVEGNRKDAEKRIHSWIKATHLEELPLAIAEGVVIDQLLEQAEAARAPLIVCGSRRLSLIERVYQSSIGTGLAGAAKIPVGVVPQPVPSRFTETWQGVA